MAATVETVDSTQSLLHINMSNITKLTGINYITWSIQVNALLDGYALLGHVDGSTTPPSVTVTTNNVATTNPAYTTWYRQDKLIYSALLGTLSPSIQALVTKSKTAREMWKTVASTYANPSRGHVLQLKNQGLTTRFDQLDLLGKPIDHEDQIDAILKGLPEDYKTVADQIEGRDVTPTITEIHEKLLTREAKLLSFASLTTVTGPVTAHTASARPRPFQAKPNHRPSQSWNQNNN